MAFAWYFRPKAAYYFAISAHTLKIMVRIALCWHYISKIVLYLRDKSGQDLIEYAMLVLMVALGASAGMGTLASGINTASENVGLQVQVFLSNSGAGGNNGHGNHGFGSGNGNNGNHTGNGNGNGKGNGGR
jgi:Flp pilus assembly pilin Flp